MARARLRPWPRAAYAQSVPSCLGPSLA